MKKFRALLLSGLALSLLVGCKGENGDKIPDPTPVPTPEPQPEPEPEPEPEPAPVKFVNLTIKEYPKTTFYCGEEFSNNGIVLNVNFSDGSSFITEDVTTSKPSSMKTPGKQTIKAYYGNATLGINSFVTYEINIIDWTKDEKLFFNATSVSSFSGTYYPKMEGMEIKQEVNDAGEVTDYWIELKNASKATVNEYLTLLDEYIVQKNIVQNGETYKSLINSMNNLMFQMILYNYMVVKSVIQFVSSIVSHIHTWIHTEEFITYITQKSKIH